MNVIAYCLEICKEKNEK